VTRNSHVVEHGTHNEYNNYDCRCDACCEAASAYYRQRKQSGKFGRCVDCQAVLGHSGRRLRCHPCAMKERATSIRPDSLRCSHCQTWKPDSMFSPSQSNRQRRGRADECKPCVAERKRIWRAEHRDEYNARERERRRKHLIQVAA
jgi:hypothetical protein